MNKTLKDDAIRRQVMLERVKTSEAEKFQTFIRKMEVDIRTRLLDEGLTINNKKRLTVLLADLTKIQEAAYEKFNSQLTLNLDDIAETSAKLEAAALTATIPDFEAIIPDAKQILNAYKENPLSIRGKGQGLTLKPFLETFTNDQINLINGRVAQGFVEGQTNAEIINSIRGTKGANFKDGVFSVIDRNAQITVRTAIQNAANAARQEVWTENDDIIQGIEWVSTLDDRTTEECQSLDGQIFPVDSGPRPPAHYGCRSSTAPVLDEDLQYLQRGGKRPSKGETESGKQDIKQVKANTTFFEWIKTQPESFQQSTLGIARAKLLNDGGLSIEDFRALQLNKNFKPMTLVEMAKEAPEAFKQAGLENYVERADK